MRLSRRTFFWGGCGAFLGLAGNSTGNAREAVLWFENVASLRTAESLPAGRLLGIRDTDIRYQLVERGAADAGLGEEDGWPAPLRLVSGIEPRAFGARADGTGDDTAALNATFRLARDRGEPVIDLRGGSYQIMSRLVVDGVCLRNLSLRMAGDSAAIRLTGRGPGISEYNIDYGDSSPPFYGEDGGVVNLHLSRGARIGPGRIAGRARRMAISCISRADNTIVEGLVSRAKWGVLFNDAKKRIVDGVDYGDISTGRNLLIRNCQFYPDPDGLLSGDGIEINTPRKRFENVQITGCAVHGTVASHNVGLGIAFCGVDTASIKDCVVYDCPSAAGALHVEHSTDVSISNCYAYDSLVGISVSMCENVHVENSIFSNCDKFSIQSFNTFGKSLREDRGKPGENLNFMNCLFIRKNDGCDIIIGRANNVNIIGNIFICSGERDTAMVYLKTYDRYGVKHVISCNNTIISSKNDINFIEVDENSSFTRYENNNFVSENIGKHILEKLWKYAR